MRIELSIGAAGLAGILLAGPAAFAVEPTAVARLGSDRFRQHGSVDAIAYAADGKTLATADRDTLHVWDAADGRRLQSIPIDNHEFFALRFAPDGKTLSAAAASGGHTRVCRIDPAAGKVLDNRLVLAERADGLFSPDGSWLALRESEGRRVWAVESATGQVLWSDPWDGYEAYSAFAFRPDGRALAVSTLKGRVRVHGAKTGNVLHNRVVAAERPVWGLAFSPDGKDLVAETDGSGVHHVTRFDPATGAVRWKHPTSRAKELAFTPDGSRVLYYGTRTSGRKEPSQWHWLDAATGQPAGSAIDTGPGHTVTVRPDGKVLAIGGFHGHVTQWDLTSRQRLDASADPPEPVTDLWFGPDGTKVRGWAGGWYEWDTKTDKQTRLTPKVGFRIPPLATASDDQRWLARFARQPDGDSWRVELADLRTGRPTHTLPGADLGDRVRFLPDGRLLVLGSTGVRLFAPATGQPTREVATTERESVVVTPDGRVAAVVARAGDGARVTRWDLAAGRKSAEWAGAVTLKGTLERLATWDGSLSADGRLVLVEFTHAESPHVRRSRVAVFELATGRRVSDWEPPVQLTPVFSPDGRSVALFSPTRYGIELRETATGGQRVRGSFARGPHACRFSPDGGTLAVSAAPGPVELWDLAGRPARRWADQDPAHLWDALANPNAERAFDAICLLRAHPAEAARLLTARMKVPAPPDPDWTAARLRDLDAANFRRREQATKDLAAAGEAVLGALRAAQATASAEARERLNGLIAKAEAPTSDKLRAIRACEVLEGIARPEARTRLAAWAQGAPGATLTREATESVERLKGR